MERHPETEVELGPQVDSDMVLSGGASLLMKACFRNLRILLSPRLKFLRHSGPSDIWQPQAAQSPFYPRG